MLLRHSVSYALTIALLLGIAGAAQAEVSGTPRNDGRVDTIIIADRGITDGVDPIPQVWHSFRSVPNAWILNPSGELRGDGWPDVAFRRGSGLPVAVWAYNRGQTYDIAISTWQGDGWRPIEFITNTAANEIDPRVFVRNDGTIDVVWWVDGPSPRVELTTRPSNGDLWEPVRRISDVGEPGRRPSVAFFNEALWVAYERDATESLFNTNEVAVRRNNGDGTFVLEFIAETQYDGPVRPVLHVRNCRFWMDWRYAEDVFAYAEIPDSNGSGESLETWNDPSWIGLESIRLIIAGIVVQAPDTTPAENEPLCVP
jgi:hypothetical protein